MPVMDRNYIAKHNIIERYLMNKLTPDERDEFEQFYINDPETLDELETTKRMYEALKRVEDDDKQRT